MITLSKKYIAEPFRIKMVETIKMTTEEERIEILKQAHYNVFNIKGEDVYIDLLTDSGTGAMSQEQWAGILRGDEAYAGAKSYFKLVETARDLFSYDYIQPVHQGRAAEKVVFPALIKPGSYCISNMFFDTTRAHVELAGGKAVDCVVEAAKNPGLKSKFKGNMDVAKLEATIHELGVDNVSLLVMTITNNSAGGQPVSMQNLKEVYALGQKYGLPVCIDAARFAENAWFIRRDEDGYQEKTIRDIVNEQFRYADLFTMSAKKDAIVNIGGLIGVRDAQKHADLVEQIKSNCINFEGFVTYGGLAGRDLEAMAIGLTEVTDLDYLNYRIGQLEYLADRLEEAGIVIQSPVGGHGIFVDARSMFPHIPYTEFPGQVLAVELYKEAGIRACEIGSYMLGNNPETGEQLKADFDFTRLAIPRRVYTQAHFDVMADALITIKERAHTIRHGYRITWEPKLLRHFQAHLEPIE